MWNLAAEAEIRVQHAASTQLPDNLQGGIGLERPHRQSDKGGFAREFERILN